MSGTGACEYLATVGRAVVGQEAIPAIRGTAVNNASAIWQPYTGTKLTEGNTSPTPIPVQAPQFGWWQ